MLFGTHPFSATGFSFEYIVTPSYNGEVFSFTITIQQQSDFIVSIQAALTKTLE